jgi:transcriptional regulator with XRE-family HTH domain
MMSPAQCRSARTLLGWSVAKLAAAAGVSERAVDDFEAELAEDAATAKAVDRAFADAGVELLPGDDIRLGAIAP